MSLTTEAGSIRPPQLRNELVLDYAPGSRERDELTAELARQSDSVADLPLVIAGRDVRTGELEPARMPHAHAHVLGYAHVATRREIQSAIEFLFSRQEPSTTVRSVVKAGSLNRA